MAAGDHSLDQITTPDQINHHRWTKDRTHALPAAEAKQQHNGKDEPAVRPDDGPESGQRAGFLTWEGCSLIDHLCQYVSAQRNGRSFVRACLTMRRASPTARTGKVGHRSISILR